MKLITLLVSLFMGGSGNSTADLDLDSVYDISINKLDSDALDLSAFKGKKVLFVNVASKCGFTPQYAQLQELYTEHGDKLEIVGVPCNQFGFQEPGTSEEIESFCQKNYGVTFTITEKVNVKGKEQHPLYAWLTQKKYNNVMDSQVKWNFQKYLVDENGELIKMFPSKVKPLDAQIVDLL